MQDRYDVIVLGAGLAGLRSAVSAAMEGAAVCLVSLGRLCAGASFYDGMEMEACQSVDDDPDEKRAWLDEIMRTSQGIADREMNRIYIDRITGAIARFPEIGVDHAKRTSPRKACFAERERPTYAWGNWPLIRSRARSITDAMGITVFEHTRLMAITKADHCIDGCILEAPKGLVRLFAPAVVLATGGFGGLYQHSLNPSDVTGQGHVMAMMNGAELINLEFIQFIPGFLSPAYKTVFREMSIPYVSSFTLSDGKPLLSGYEADEILRIRSEHGPFSCETGSGAFDIAITHAIQRGEQGVCVHYRDDILRDESTFIRPYVDWLKKTRGIDIAKEPIYVAPFYHASNGGIRIDTKCRTAVPGLYACGEAAGGIHGADRQGGMSTGSCLVFGEIAGLNAARYAAEAGEMATRRDDPENTLRLLYGGGSGDLTPEYVMAKIREILWVKASIVRSREGLLSALTQIQNLQRNFCMDRWLSDERTRGSSVHAWCASRLAEAVLTSMMLRHESRGSHYREDYPSHDINGHRMRSVISLESGQIKGRLTTPSA